MEKVTPNGSKIALLRKSKEVKQTDFAQRVGMSIRKYRDIETKSLPISQRELQEIADKLSDKLGVVSAEALLARSNVEHVPDPPWAGEIQLRPVDGTRLIRMARMSDSFDYHVLVPIGKEHLEAIVPILRIVQRICGAVGILNLVSDEFDEKDFPDLHRIACLNDAIEKLKTTNIGVFANTYPFLTPIDVDTLMCVAFADGKEKTVNVLKRREEPDTFAREVDEDDQVGSLKRELDDEVPF